MSSVIVIGAGLSGLAAACHLTAAGHDVTVLEREAIVGGRAGMLRLGDFRDPPVDWDVSLVTSPFRSFLHLPDDGERLAVLRAVRELLLPGGRLAFDVFEPSREDIEAHLAENYDLADAGSVVDDVLALSSK